MISLLEVESDRELQLPHACPAFETGDLPIVATLAINASRGPVIRTKCIYRVVEHIEGIYTELRV